MTWQTVQKSAYLSDFVELNKNLQQAVVKAIQEMEQDPVELPWEMWTARQDRSTIQSNRRI